MTAILPRDERASTPTQIALLAGRVLAASWADRRLAMLGLAQPVVLLLLFSQVFSSVAVLPGVDRYGSYVNFLVPATMVNIALTTALGSGGGLLSDLYSGVSRRLQVLPVRPFAVLAGRAVADAVRLVVQLVFVLGVAVALLGFRPTGGIIECLTALVLCVVLGFGLSWLFLALCAWGRTPQMLQTVGFVAVFPLMFSSSAYMPIDLLPTWLQVVATVNPLTHAVDAVRALFLHQQSSTSLLTAVGLTAVVGVASAVWATRSLRTVTS